MKKHIYGLFLAAILFFGCYDDKGNYDYKSLAEVEIKLPESAYTRQFGEALQIVPTVTTTIPESDLAYDWEFYTDTLDASWNQWISVSSERILDYVCELDGKLFPLEGTYDLQLHLTQLSTGRQFYSDAVSVTLQAEPSDWGLMVLHGDGISSDIGVIVADEFQMSASSVTEKVDPRAYSSANGGAKIAGKGWQIMQTYVSYANYSPDYIVVIALTDNGSAVAYSKTWQKRGEWNDLFVGGLNKSDPQACEINDYNLYVFDGGDIFWRQAYKYRFATPLLASEDYEYDFWPWIWFPSDWQGLLFDKVSRGFIKVLNIWNFDSFSPIDALEDGSVAGLAFNPTDMQADLVCMDAGGLFGHFLAVMRTDDGTHFLAEMDLLAASSSGVPMYKYDLSVVQPDKAVAWAFGSGIRMCYCARPDGVYRFDADAGQAINPEKLKKDDNEEMAFDGDVVFMKLLKPGVDGGSYYLSGVELVVGTYGGSAGSGKLYSMELDPFSGFVKASSVKIYKGFDEIYDVDIKCY